MHATKPSYYYAHPLVLFWIGVLTGAIIVSLIFAYRYLNTTEYKSAALKSPTYYKTQTIQPKKTTKPTTTKKQSAPKSKAATQKGSVNQGDPNPW